MEQKEVNDLESRARQTLTIRDIGFLLTIITNVVIAVWIASKVTTTVEHLVISVTSLEVTVREVRGDLMRVQNDFNGRLSRVEERLRMIDSNVK